MALHLIIDGYNLLGARGQVGIAAGWESEPAREQLLRELAAYRQVKGHPITVVFDAWRQGLGAGAHEHRAGIEVMYSRRGEQADLVIQRLAAEFGCDCAVVSSDREVQAFAKAQGAFVMGAAEFDAKLRARPAVSPPFAKQLRGRDADDLLRRPPDKRGNPKKLPKALRKRQRQLRGF